MATIFDFAASAGPGTLILIDAAARSTLLLAVAMIAALALRRSSAAARHRAWALALCGLIAMPVVSASAPGWRFPWVAANPIMPADRPTPILDPLATSGPLTAAPPSRPAPIPDTVAASPARAGTQASPPAPARSAIRSTLPAAPAPAIPVPSSWTWDRACLAIWGVGCLMAISPTLLSLLLLECRRRRSTPVSSGEWASLLAEIRREQGIGRPVELRRDSTTPIPITWGVVRPVVLLPEGSEAWTEATRRLVLRHELAHVARLDAGTLLVGRLAAAIHWFHPLAWFALGRMRVECEHATDDRVLLAGERPTDYAASLLDLARSLRRPTPGLATAVSMSRVNHLEGRMKAMFDRNRSHAPLGRRPGLFLALAATLAVSAIATARPGPAAATQPATASPPVAEGAGRIAGRVVLPDGTTPAGGVEVVILPPPPNNDRYYYGKVPVRAIRADARGEFAFEKLPAGRYRVWANSGRLTSRGKSLGGREVIVPASGDPPGPVTIKLADGVAVMATVKDKATGKPIPGATIDIGWSDLVDDFTTGADGRAVVQPLTRQRWSLEARAEGHARETRGVNLEDGIDAREDFLLGPGGDIEGVVRDPSGKPLADVGLSVFVEGSNTQQEYVTTGPDGRYRLANLPVNAGFKITASKKDYGRKEFLSSLTGPKATQVLVFGPDPDGGSIVGIVRDHSGKPVAGAELTNQGRSSDEERTAKTGPDGRFRMDNLFEGSNGKDVIVRAKGSSPKRQRVEVGTREAPGEVAIDLEAGHSIKGRVVDEKGKPIAGVMVDFSHGINAFTDGGRMDSDAEGRFAFDALPDDAPFGFRKEGFSDIHDRHLTLDGDETVTVTMTPAGAILGRVVDARTGRPIERFNVRITFAKQLPGDVAIGGIMTRLVDPGQDYRSPEGKFRIGDMVVGAAFQVSVQAEGYERAIAERVVVGRDGEAAPEGFSLRPTDPASLTEYRIRLRDPDDRPVAGAQLRLIVAGPRSGRRHDFPFNWQMIQTGQIASDPKVLRFFEGVSGPDGRFTFEKVPKGAEVELAWWGKACPPGRSDHLETLDTRPDERIDILVPAAGKAAIKVDRKAFPNAGNIWINGPDDGIAHDYLELKGDRAETEIANLAPGTYRLSLMGRSESIPGKPGMMRSDTLSTKSLEIKPGETTRIDFD